jgi:hypothetical protein
MQCGEFKRRYWFFADTPNTARNCRLFEKIYDGESILPVVSNIGEMYKIVVSIKCMVWKVCRSPTLCRFEKTIINCLQITETEFAE